MNTYFKQEYITLSFDEEKRLGVAVWQGFLSSEQFRMASTTSLRLIQEKQLLYWLSDNRQMKAIRQQDQEWFNAEIIPVLAKSSLVKMAVLISEDIFNQMGVESLHTRASNIIHFDHFYFRSEEEALNWLIEPSV